MSAEAWHGSYGGYSNHRCRCEGCTVANREYQAKRRMERYAEGVPSTVVHNANTYTNWGCRCATCSDAHRESKRLVR